MAVVKIKFSVVTAFTRGGWDLLLKTGPQHLLKLVRHPTNKFDPNAVAICVPNGGKLNPCGYLTSKMAADIAPLIEKGVHFECRRLNDPRLKGICILAYDDDDKGKPGQGPGKDGDFIIAE